MLEQQTIGFGGSVGDDVDFLTPPPQHDFFEDSREDEDDGVSLGCSWMVGTSEAVELDFDVSEDDLAAEGGA